MGIYKALSEIPDSVIGSYIDRQTRFERIQELGVPEVVFNNERHLYEEAQQSVVRELENSGIMVSPESISDLVEKASILYKSRQLSVQRSIVSDADWEPLDKEYHKINMERAELLDRGLPRDLLPPEEDIFQQLSEEYGIPVDRIRTRMVLNEEVVKDYFRRMDYLVNHEDDEAILEKSRAMQTRNLKIGKFVQNLRSQHGVKREVYRAFGISKEEGVLFENGLRPLEDLPDGLLDMLGEVLDAQEEIDGIKLEYHL
jgi:hypothetical protein